MTNITLIFLFRPATTLQSQTPNPNIPPTGSIYLHQIVSSYDVHPTLQAILPTLIPLAALALAASHGFIVLRWVVEAVAERLLWRGSEEELEVQKLSAQNNQQLHEQLAAIDRKEYKDISESSGFWNGGEEGARAISSVGKSE